MFFRKKQNIKTSEPPKNKWIKGVNSIRFILAFIVMLSHYENPFYLLIANSEKLKPYAELALTLFNGVAAVIAFFIISGFVVHYTAKNQIRNWKSFLLKRYIRILFPLAIVFLLGYPLNHPEKGILWSLICELVYYTIYPIMYYKQSVDEKKILWIAFLISISIIPFIAYNDLKSLIFQTNYNYHGHYWQSGIFSTWIIGLPCWLLGVRMANRIESVSIPTKQYLLRLRFFIYVLSVLLFIGQKYFYLSFIISMNIFSLLLYKWLMTEILYYKKHEPNPYLERMGDFSYSLYILHPVIYAFILKYFTLSLYIAPLLIIPTLILTYLFYLVVEKPSHNFAKSIN